MKLSSRIRRCAVLAPLAAAALGLAATGRPAKADVTDQTELHERCATRLSIAILGKSPDATLMAAADPQSQVDTMLQSTDFIERFSRFVNASFNQTPGMTAEQDSAYYMAQKILTDGKPWSDMFLGQYMVTADDQGNVSVQTNADGLGYFRSPAWLKRYAGNEQAGIKISTAYRIMNNVLGLKLTATTNDPNVDRTAAGRQGGACKGCHYDPWYALDKVAGILSKRVGTGDKMTFTAYTGGPQQILGGISVADDKQLVQALVNSDGFKFNVCRLAFKFLYGRPENVCEFGTFDKCVDAFTQKQTIQSAISAVAKDATFCQ